MSLFRSFSFFSLMIYPLLNACSNEPTPSHLRITKGHKADAQTSSAVALLKKDYKEGFYTYCTGVLLSPTHLLTAAHCSLDKGQVMRLEELRVAVGVDQPDQNLTQLGRVAFIQVHPDYNPQHLLPDSDGLLRPSKASDLAVWTLEQPTAHQALAQILDPSDVNAAFIAGAPFTLTGYGVSSPWEGKSNPLLRQAESLYQPIVQLSVTKQVLFEGRLIKRTFTYEVEARAEFEFYLGAKTLPDTCKGDSGGPVFVNGPDQKPRIIGLTSRGDRACAQGGVYTLLPSYFAWIKQQIEGQPVD